MFFGLVFDSTGGDMQLQQLGTENFVELRMRWT